MFGDVKYRLQFVCVMYALVQLCIALVDVFVQADLIGWMFDHEALTWVLLPLLRLAAPYCKRFFKRL